MFGRAILLVFMSAPFYLRKQAREAAQQPQRMPGFVRRCTIL
jgi:hypothetical protein